VLVDASPKAKVIPSFLNYHNRLFFSILKIHRRFSPISKL